MKADLNLTNLSFCNDNIHTVLGGLHYLPGDGNLIFGDGEVLKKIVISMPKRVEYFKDNEVVFVLCLGEPTGGASLSVAEAYVALQNDIGEVT